METVSLAGTGLTPSRLGFGSAALMARLGRRASIRLLEVAHESGITHFDTARSYGYGEAESAVGQFLAGRRDGVTITTKLGLEPPPHSATMRAVKTAGREVIKRAPGLRPILRRRAQAMVRPACFEPGQARASLETSLRELRVETVDFLLLHECRPADLESEGLLEFLEQAVREGKIRHFGLATDRESTGYALSRRAELASVVQLAHSVVEPSLARLPLDGRPVITHSAVRLGLPPLLELMRDQARRTQWSRALAIDCAQSGGLARLLLAEALLSNAGGVVLFSSTHEDTIHGNTALVGGAELTEEQVREFGRLTREALSPGDQPGH